MDVQSCWSGEYEFWNCCATSYGASGNMECWSGPFTYENCCLKQISYDCNFNDTVLLAALSCFMMFGTYALMRIDRSGVVSTKEPPTQTHTGTSRAPHLDATKFWANMLVIFLHTTSTMPVDQSVPTVAADFASTTCCLISGASSANKSAKSDRRFLIRTLAPYVLFQLVLEPLGRYVQGQSYFGNGHLWYIVGLVCWRCGAFILRPLGLAGSTFCAVIFAFVAGYQDWSPELNQVIYHIPDFFIGRAFSRHIFQPSPSKVLHISILLAVCALHFHPDVYQYIARIDYFRGWANKQFQSCSVAEYYFFWVRRLFTTTFMTMKSLLFIRCHSASHSLISNMGRNSMYPYMLHMLLVPACQRIIFTVTSSNESMLIMAFVGSCFLVAVLSSQFTRLVFKIIIEPTWLEVLLPSPTPEDE